MLGVSQIIFVVNFFQSMFAGKKAEAEPVAGRHARVDACRSPPAAPQLRRRSPPCVRGPHEYANPEVKKRARPRLARAGRRDASRGVAEQGGGGGLGSRCQAAPPWVRSCPTGRAAHEETTAYIGMVIFLGAWAMMFGALFFAYGMVRARAMCWPPPDPEPAAAPARPSTPRCWRSAAWCLQLSVMGRALRAGGGRGPRARGERGARARCSWSFRR